MRKTVLAPMQAPEGQSAAADGAAPARPADTAAPAPEVSEAPASDAAAEIIALLQAQISDLQARVTKLEGRLKHF
ncbi:MAG: hypothetical protein KGL39_30850 [Patescibacteria group bacterium]|nr:hypothetical protein [Patescibacteria group bacterium]